MATLTNTAKTPVLNYIITDMETTLHRLGINTKLSVEKSEENDCLSYGKLVGTPFQTTPMIFREIHIEGNIYVSERGEGEDGKVLITFNLFMYYSYFGGGSNGHNLGNITYEVSKNIDEKLSNHPNLFVRKIKSLEI